MLWFPLWVLDAGFMKFTEHSWSNIRCDFVCQPGRNFTPRICMSHIANFAAFLAITWLDQKAWKQEKILANTTKAVIPYRMDLIIMFLTTVYISLSEWMPSSRKESGYPIIRDFASSLGLAFMVRPPCRESWELKKHSYLLGRINPNITY